MNSININDLLHRENLFNEIKDKLNEIYTNKNISKGIYIYGPPGAGKTEFIKNICKTLNYDIITYDSSELRNKNILENISNLNMSTYNVYSLLTNNYRKIVILMDEIDCMNNGDKGGINTLIKMVRVKKTTKQKNEESTHNPIVCIGNNENDKKIKELMKVCSVYEIKMPTNTQIKNILDRLFLNVSDKVKDKLLVIINNDLKKLHNLYTLYQNNYNVFINSINNNIISNTNNNNFNKDDILNLLIKNKINIDNHNLLINENDRTTISLLYHENIINLLSKINIEKSINFYYKILNNYCYADYIDRITFQKQVWQFNEITSYIKICYTNLLLNEFIKNNNINTNKTFDIRFTKILTKYSTEYNNLVFINNLCYTFSLEKNELLLFFKLNDNINYILENNYELSKLDYNRIKKYITYLEL
jgi:hypothetical protein